MSSPAVVESGNPSRLQLLVLLLCCNCTR